MVTELWQNSWSPWGPIYLALRESGEKACMGRTAGLSFSMQNYWVDRILGWLGQRTGWGWVAALLVSCWWPPQVGGLGLVVSSIWDEERYTYMYIFWNVSFSPMKGPILLCLKIRLSCALELISGNAVNNWGKYVYRFKEWDLPQSPQSKNM